jgi:hypothetical protein
MRRLPAVDQRASLQRAPCRAPIYYASSLRTVTTVHHGARVIMRPWPCLDALQKLKFFTLSITSIFGPMYEVVNVGTKITNYTV